MYVYSTYSYNFVVLNFTDSKDLQSLLMIFNEFVRQLAEFLPNLPDCLSPILSLLTVAITGPTTKDLLTATNR